MESSYGSLVTIIKGNTTWITEVAMGKCIGMMDQSIKANGKMVNKMGRESLIWLMVGSKKAFFKVTGLLREEKLNYQVLTQCKLLWSEEKNVSLSHSMV